MRYYLFLSLSFFYFVCSSSLKAQECSANVEEFVKRYQDPPLYLDKAVKQHEKRIFNLLERSNKVNSDNVVKLFNIFYVYIDPLFKNDNIYSDCSFLHHLCHLKSYKSKGKHKKDDYCVKQNQGTNGSLVIFTLIVDSTGKFIASSDGYSVDDTSNNKVHIELSKLFFNQEVMCILQFAYERLNSFLCVKKDDLFVIEEASDNGYRIYSWKDWIRKRSYL